MTMAFDSNMFGSSLGGLFGGLFGDSGAPYDKAMEQYARYGQMAQGTQQPYLNAGTSAIPAYQQWLQSQQDPSKFVNNLQNQYQQSPYNLYLQQQAQRAGENAASASGMLGSTPFVQQQQQNASNIASSGLNDWLQNVLGINTQYGQGQHNLMQGGQNSANSLSQLYNNLGQQMGEASYGKEAGRKHDFWNTLGGGLGLIGSFL